MRTRKVTMIAFRDQSTGELGLGVEGSDFNSEAMNAATEGLLIAHDLLEHVNGIKAIGPIADELEALGGIWFVRGQHGELRRDNVGAAWNTHQNVAYDITRMFRDWFYNREYLPSVRTRACAVDVDLDEILRFAESHMLDEFDADEKAEASKHAAEFLAASLACMRTGYRKAYKRFQGAAGKANTLFWDIVEAVEPYCKRAEYEGQRFELVYGIDRDGWPFARCGEDYGEDY